MLLFQLKGEISISRLVFENLTKTIKDKKKEIEARTAHLNFFKCSLKLAGDLFKAYFDSWHSFGPNQYISLPIKSLFIVGQKIWKSHLYLFSMFKMLREFHLKLFSLTFPSANEWLCDEVASKSFTWTRSIYRSISGWHNADRTSGRRRGPSASPRRCSWSCGSWRHERTAQGGKKPEILIDFIR